MNIFATYKCPTKSAKALDDLRVNKMIVESAQMLSTVMRLKAGVETDVLVHTESGIKSKKIFILPQDELDNNSKPYPTLISRYVYSVAYKNHPCTLWVAECWENYNWLLCHFISLLGEYTLRSGKVHACNILSHKFRAFLDSVYDYDKERTPFVNCTDFKHIEDVHEAYKECLLAKWKKDVKPPKWYGEIKSEFIDFNKLKESLYV